MSVAVSSAPSRPVWASRLNVSAPLPRSAPAQNARPRPVTTTARTSSSASVASNASISSRIIVGGERVEPVGAVQGDRGHPIGDGVGDVLEVGHGRHSPIARCALAARSVTWLHRDVAQSAVHRIPRSGAEPGRRRARTRSRDSDPQPLGQALAVVGRAAEQQLRGLRALEVQVGVVLPGEADAAVDLDVLGRRVQERLRAVGLGDARGDAAARRASSGRRPAPRRRRPSAPTRPRRARRRTCA